MLDEFDSKHFEFSLFSHVMRFAQNSQYKWRINVLHSCNKNKTKGKFKIYKIYVQNELNRMHRTDILMGFTVTLKHGIAFHVVDFNHSECSDLFFRLQIS